MVRLWLMLKDSEKREAENVPYISKVQLRGPDRQTSILNLNSLAAISTATQSYQFCFGIQLIRTLYTGIFEVSTKSADQNALHRNLRGKDNTSTQYVSC